MSSVASYRSDIDGLRALSVILVIGYHLKVPSFMLGYLGVDMFFVISGFVITKLLFRQFENGTFSYAGFYAQRAKRLFPALYLTLFLTSVFFAYSAPSWKLDEFTRNLFSSIFFVQNFNLALTSNYFSDAAETNPLLHIWSLAVEEQFYLIWPIFFYGIYRYTNYRLLTCVVILGLGYLLYHIIGFYSSNFQFYSVISRGWQLVIGAVAYQISLIIQFHNGKRLVSPTIFRTVVFAVLFSTLFGGLSELGLPNLERSLVTLLTAIFLIFHVKNDIFDTVLSQKFIVFVGKISYGLYLYHWSIIVLYSYNFGLVEHAFHKMIIVIVTLIFASLSYRFYENPIRYSTNVSNRMVGITSLISVIFLILVVVNLQSIQKASQSLRLSNQSEIELFEMIENSFGRDIYDEMYDQDCNFWFNKVSVSSQQRASKCFEEFGKAIVVIGDSHALNIYNAFAQTQSSKKAFLLGISSGGCRITSTRTDCSELYEELKRMTESGMVKSIIYHQSGHHLLENVNNVTGDNSIFWDRRQYFGVDHEEITSIQRSLFEFTDDSKVIWLGPFAEARIDFNFIYPVISQNIFFSANSLEYFDILGSELNNKNSNNNRIEYVDFRSIWNFDSYLAIDEECVIFQDLDHLSQCGEHILSYHLSRSSIDLNSL